MDVATTLTHQGLSRAGHTVGKARAAELAAGARTLERLRLAVRVMFAGLAFMSIWGAAGLVGTLAAMH